MQERIDHLVHTLSERRDNKIILPAPALAEFMLLANDRWKGYLTIIRRRAVFEITGFDAPESIELVEHWLTHGDGKRVRYGSQDSWAKLKYDRQIVAIAKTRRVDTVYSIDSDVHELCEEIGIKCLNVSDLPLPPPRQLKLVEQMDQDSKQAKASDPAAPANVSLAAAPKGKE